MKLFALTKEPFPMSVFPAVWVKFTVFWNSAEPDRNRFPPVLVNVASFRTRLDPNEYISPAEWVNVPPKSLLRVALLRIDMNELSSRVP